MLDDNPAIAVLGPTAEDAPEDAIGTARELGRRLAQAGYTVLGSGVHGTGPAAVQAALRADGRAALITEGEGHRDLAAAQILEVSGPLARIQATVDHADAVFFVGGDLEALAVLLQIWAHGHTASGAYCQLVLVGDRWPGVVKALADAATLDQRSRAMVTFAGSPEHAVEAIRYFVAPPP